MDNTNVLVLGVEQIYIASSDWDIRSRLLRFAQLVEKGELKLEIQKDEEVRRVTLIFKAVSRG